MKAHFQELLKMNGFILSEKGNRGFLDKDVKNDMKNDSIVIEKDLLKEYVESDNKSLKKFDYIHQNVLLLGLPNDKVMEYEDIVTDNHKITNYINTIQLLKTDDYIDKKIIEEKEKSFIIKKYSSNYNKIKLLRTVEKKYNIGFLKVDYFNSAKNVKINMEKKFFDEILMVYKMRRKKPDDMKDLGVLYRAMLKTIAGNDIIVNDKKTSKINYSLNIDYLKSMIKLNKYKNTKLVNFNFYIKNIISDTKLLE